jgi:aryl-alcohol dehydrogenase-like predicted oxidoreductase
MMDETQRHLAAAEIERRLLAALCAPGFDHQARTEMLERLATYKFANPDHDVIFRALAKMPRAGVAQIRETLSARLTRLGFPDIDVEQILDVEPPSSEEISGLLRQLGR